MTEVDGRVGEHRLRVRWGETDPFGIVFYPTFYAWMDQATHEFFRTSVTSFADLFEQAGYALPIVEASCRFRAPARYDDELIVVSRVTSIRGRSFRIDHTFTRGGTELAVGFEARAFARLDPDDATRLTTGPLPDSLRGYLAGDRDTPL